MTHEDLAPFVESGMVNARRHPSLPLTIYNYSKQAPAEYRKPSEWPEPVRLARGLVLDDDGHVVARSFPKFFNVSEYGDAKPEWMQNRPDAVHEKYDGSLLLAFAYEGEVVTATRGSFESEQAREGAQILRASHPNLTEHVLASPGLTFLCEVIYPANRIVVDYGGDERLVLLGVVNRAGNEMDPRRYAGVVCAEQYPDLLDTPLAELPERENAEGYVLVWRLRYGTFRAKVKHDAYVKAHRVVFGLTARRLWDCLREGQDVEKLLEPAPEEFRDWGAQTAQRLREEHAAIISRAEAEVRSLSQMPDRKATALAFKEHADSPLGLLFGLVDGQDIADRAWALVRPDHELPFAEVD